MTNFAKEIRAIRKALGMNQADFAEAADVSQGSVSKWERGLESPKTAAWLRIKALWDMHEGQRLGGPFDPFYSPSLSSEVITVAVLGPLSRDLEADVFQPDFAPLMMLAIPKISSINNRVVGFFVPPVMTQVSDVRPGSVVFTELQENFAPEPGDRVIVQQKLLDGSFLYDLVYYGRTAKGLEWFTSQLTSEAKVRLSEANLVSDRAETGRRAVGKYLASFRWEDPTKEMLDEIAEDRVFGIKF